VSVRSGAAAQPPPRLRPLAVLSTAPAALAAAAPAAAPAALHGRLHGHWLRAVAAGGDAAAAESGDAPPVLATAAVGQRLAFTLAPCGAEGVALFDLRLRAGGAAACADADAAAAAAAAAHPPAAVLLTRDAAIAAEVASLAEEADAGGPAAVRLESFAL
jgi:hypothetical protein